MIPLDSLLTFIAASVLLALAPGPDNLFVAAQSALYGARAGLIVTLGLCSGLIVHTSAVALGVAVVFQTSAIAFTLLKIAGALYLGWLAWQVFRAPVGESGAPQVPAMKAAALYRRGILMNVTNPKVSVFFLAFLPQFASPAQGPVALQVFQLGAWFMLSAFLVFSVIALTAGKLAQRLGHSAKVQRWLNRTAGLVFTLMALRLLSSSQIG
ncbi:LysE family translocator [Granulosicoccaceae sp. 1_MG-2023]|nr:LysE family translocator [Granulosicoccaceae sp. 1_MG-2023]